MFGLKLRLPFRRKRLTKDEAAKARKIYPAEIEPPIDKEPTLEHYGKPNRRFRGAKPGSKKRADKRRRRAIKLSRKRNRG